MAKTKRAANFMDVHELIRVRPNEVGPISPIVKDGVLMTHALVPAVLGIDVIKSLCAEMKYNLWCQVLSEPYLVLPIRRPLEFPFERALFWITPDQWRHVKTLLDEVQIYIDGVCNVTKWSTVTVPRLPDTNLINAQVHVLSLGDANAFWEPVVDNGKITFQQRPSTPMLQALSDWGSSQETQDALQYSIERKMREQA